MSNKKKIKLSSCIIKAIIIAISSIIFFFIMKYILLWVPTLAELLEYIKTPLKESFTWKVIGLTLAIGLSIGLYQIKKKFIIIFGFIEIAGGGWSIWATFSQDFENNILYALAIAGGIFLFINGIENTLKYKEQTKEQ